MKINSFSALTALMGAGGLSGGLGGASSSLNGGGGMSMSSGLGRSDMGAMGSSGMAERIGMNSMSDRIGMSSMADRLDSYNDRYIVKNNSQIRILVAYKKLLFVCYLQHLYFY